jgi:integrase
MVPDFLIRQRGGKPFHFERGTVAMSKLKRPSYLFHKATKQARVRIDGKWKYLGVFGTPKSKARYEKLCADWLHDHQDEMGDESARAETSLLTIDDLALLYMRHVRQHYRKDGQPTSEVSNIRVALRYIVRRYGEKLARKFGPKSLKTIRQDMIDGGIVRTSINRIVSRIKGMFSWAVSEELLDVTVYQALRTVRGLEEGRSAAIESPPVMPVSDADVEAVRPFVTRPVWAAIQLQRLTGARPGEILSMRGCDLDMTGDVWVYSPASHKMQHRKRSRAIHLGPRAQTIVAKFLKTDPSAYLFSPRDAWEEYLRKRRENRATPLTPSQRARRRKAKPKKQPGDRYTVCSYGQAIRVACLRANQKARADHGLSDDQLVVAPWHPHQLRHTSATEIRRLFDLDTARSVLGQGSVSTAEIYAERDRKSARDAIGLVG